MTHFRFRYKQIGYMRWRCRTARRRALLLVLPLEGVARRKSTASAWRCTILTFTLLPPATVKLKIGKFVVSEKGDPQLLGHPNIRY